MNWNLPMPPGPPDALRRAADQSGIPEADILAAVRRRRSHKGGEVAKRTLPANHWRRAGREGGLATRDKHGVRYLQAQARKGGRASAAKRLGVGTPPRR